MVCLNILLYRVKQELSGFLAMTAGERNDRLMEKSPPTCLLFPVNLLKSKLSLMAHNF